MAVAGLVLLAIGTAVQVSGQIKAGKAAKAAGEFNARVAEENAEAARLQAAEKERRFRISSRKLLGLTRARIGGSGVAFDGSVLDVLEETVSNAELDALTIRHAGEVSALAFLNQASVERFKGEAARRNANLKAVGTLLQGAGAIFGKLPSGAASTPQSSLGTTGPSTAEGGVNQFNPIPRSEIA